MQNENSSLYIRVCLWRAYTKTLPDFSPSWSHLGTTRSVLLLGSRCLNTSLGAVSGVSFWPKVQCRPPNPLLLLPGNWACLKLEVPVTSSRPGDVRVSEIDQGQAQEMKTAMPTTFFFNWAHMNAATLADTHLWDDRATQDMGWALAHWEEAISRWRTLAFIDWIQEKGQTSCPCVIACFEIHLLQQQIKVNSESRRLPLGLIWVPWAAWAGLLISLQSAHITDEETEAQSHMVKREFHVTPKPAYCSQGSRPF
jgi:hypothetical protein